MGQFARRGAFEHSVFAKSVQRTQKGDLEENLIGRSLIRGDRNYAGFDTSHYKQFASRHFVALSLSKRLQRASADSDRRSGKKLLEALLLETLADDRISSAGGVQQSATQPVHNTVRLQHRQATSPVRNTASPQWLAG